MSGLPLVVTLQGETVMDDADIFEQSRALRAALRFGLRHAAAVTGCSAFTLEDAERRFGLPAGSGRVIFNGVSLDPGDAAVGEVSNPRDFRRRLGISDRPYIMAVGRVVEKKGFDLLLSAFAAIDRGRRSVDLVIGGAGNALDDLQRLAGDLGIAAQVHFVGRLSRQEVAEAMSDALVFVMPSRLEPFGIVVLEAWRAGVAVMATIHGGPSEFVVDGVDGVLVDPFDVATLAAKLDALIHDAPRRRAIAAAGRSRVEAFSWPTIADEYREVYDSVVHPGGGSAPAVGIRRQEVVG
jgi:glycosyltransferase involved in cell wall biosynthesis